MKVAILGAGPSAAYIATACEDFSVEYDIISSRSPTLFFPGSFWLRQNPWTALMPVTKVHIYSTGSAIGYLRKQWKMVDPAWLLHTSFPEISRTELVWNPYDFLIPFWKNKDILLIKDLSDEDIKDIAEGYDAVFMTFATQKSKKVMEPFVIKYPIISYNAEELAKVDNETYPLTSTLLSSKISYCIYDGDAGHHMTRVSQLFGYVHFEYSQYYIPTQELIGNGKVTWVSDTYPATPEWNPQDVPADNIILVGRHAQWNRKILSHHAYEQTVKILEQKL